LEIRGIQLPQKKTSATVKDVLEGNIARLLMRLVLLARKATTPATWKIGLCQGIKSVSHAQPDFLPPMSYTQSSAIPVLLENTKPNKPNRSVIRAHLVTEIHPKHQLLRPIVKNARRVFGPRTGVAFHANLVYFLQLCFQTIQILGFAFHVQKARCE
jgi:hypothetical protein